MILIIICAVFNHSNRIDDVEELTSHHVELLKAALIAMHRVRLSFISLAHSESNAKALT